MLALQSVGIAVFVLVHLFAGRLRFLDGTPRSRWLSFAGGISVAYVFVHLFPDLAEAQEELDGSVGVAWLEHHAYVVAMTGLVAFYGLERTVQDRTVEPHESGEADGGETDEPPRAGKGAAVFRLHLGMFALYNALIGYLLVHRVEQDARGLLLFTFAYALHFVVNDHGLARHYQARYRHVGRWLLTAAVLVGWAVGRFVDVSENAVHVLFALLAGATILNVMKEELPEERQSRFLPFLGGAVGYAALMMAL